MAAEMERPGAAGQGCGVTWHGCRGSGRGVLGVRPPQRRHLERAPCRARRSGAPPAVQGEVLWPLG